VLQLPFLIDLNTTMALRGKMTRKCHWYTCRRFFVPVFCTDQAYLSLRISNLTVFDLIIKFTAIFKLFYHSAVTRLMWSLIAVSPQTEAPLSETSHQLSQRGVTLLHVN
jgi:hypothetical protein